MRLQKNLRGTVAVRGSVHPALSFFRRSARPDLQPANRPQISSQPAATIAEMARHFGQEDDITVVSVQFTGAATMAEAHL